MFIFTEHNLQKDAIEQAVLSADESAEIWQNGIESSLTVEQIDSVVPANVRDLQVQDTGCFTEVLRDGFLDTDEYGRVHNATNQIVGFH